MRIMSGNAFLLSILYLLVGIGVELLRRYRPSLLILKLSLSLDSLPARALELLRLMEPLREAYFSGRISESALRLIFGATTVGIIFVLAVGVGLIMGTLRGFLLRQAARRN